jgi:hypothetical protein
MKTFFKTNEILARVGIASYCIFNVKHCKERKKNRNIFEVKTSLGTPHTFYSRAVN